MTKPYKLALFGLSRAGKSCILAALAAPKVGHPRQYTADFVPVATPLPEKVNSNSLLARLHMGQDWINTNVEAIKNRTLPEPTTQVSPPPIFRFAFGTPDRKFVIEFIDYAGGNIDPAMADTKIAADLRVIMSEMDGLLVILEVPNDNSEDDSERKRAFEAANKLAAAFALITCQSTKQKSEPLDFPIALLINKWDKKGSALLSYKNLNGIKAELHKLFKDETNPHGNLRAALKAGLREGDFQVFPVSALGLCGPVPSNDDGKPVPIQNYPLAPFYLLEPFVWITKQRDLIDLRKLKGPTKFAKKWWQYLLPAVSYQQVQRGRRLLSRLPSGASEERAAVSSGLWRWGAILFGRSMAALLVFLAIIFIPIWGIELAYDYPEYRPIRTVIDSTGKSDTELKRANSWLTNYINDPWYCHWAMRTLFLPKTDKAQVWKNQVFKELDKICWDRVINAPTLSERAERAQKYELEMPNGAHMVEAQAFVDEHKQKTSCAQAEQEIFDFLGLGKFVEARNKAEQWISSQCTLPVETYKKNVLPRLETALSSKGWGIKGARPEIAELLNNCQQTPSVLLPEGGYEQCRKWKGIYDDNVDHFLYDYMLENKDDEARIDKYISSAPRKYMLQEAEALKQYRQRLKGNLDLTLVITEIEWENSWGEPDNDVKVTMNGKPCIRGFPIKSTKNSSTGNIGRFEWKAKLDTIVNLHARIEVKVWGRIRLQGEGSLNGMQLKELATGYRWALSGEDGAKCTVVLRLDGIPPVPTPRPWSKDR